jgi:XTP/dITP diphosphohydrolase
VDALGGAPGVRSARFAADEISSEANASDAANNQKLLRLLREVPWEKRTARFHCVLALVDADPRSAIRDPQLFEGTCEGRIAFAPRGQGGFGYDPLFVPDGFEISFAELGEEVKNRLSHRFKALWRLKKWLAVSSGGQ